MAKMNWLYAVLTAGALVACGSKDKQTTTYPQEPAATTQTPSQEGDIQRVRGTDTTGTAPSNDITPSGDPSQYPSGSPATTPDNTNTTPAPTPMTPGPTDTTTPTPDHTTTQPDMTTPSPDKNPTPGSTMPK